MRTIVMTSNNYTHCLPGFAYLWNKYYGEDESVLVGHYEVAPPRLPENFTCVRLGVQLHYSWSAGMLRMLELVKDETISLWLEDYWLARPVNRLQINAIKRFMEENSQVARFDLTNDRWRYPHIETNGHETGFSAYTGQLVRSAPTAKFTLSLQAGIWRTNFLLKYLNTDENAWECEMKGTERMNADNALVLGTSQPPVEYQIAIKARKVNLWRVEKFSPEDFRDLQQRGFLESPAAIQRGQYRYE